MPSGASILVTPCHRKPEAAWLREIFTNFLFVFISSCRRNRKSYFCLEGHFDWNFSGSKLDFAVSYLYSYTEGVNFELALLYFCTVFVLDTLDDKI